MKALLLLTAAFALTSCTSAQRQAAGQFGDGLLTIGVTLGQVPAGIATGISKTTHAALDLADAIQGPPKPLPVLVPVASSGKTTVDVRP